MVSDLTKFYKIFTNNTKLYYKSHDGNVEIVILRFLNENHFIYKNHNIDLVKILKEYSNLIANTKLVKNILLEQKTKNLM